MLLSLALVVCLTLRLAGQQEPRGGDSSSTVASEKEYDQWRGSTLGIRVEDKDEKVFVDFVHQHLEDSSPFRAGDQIVSIDGIEINVDNLPELGKLLRNTPPESELDAVVRRDDQRVELSVRTFRRPLVDIAEIHRRLDSNSIIKAHLESSGRPNFMDDMAERMSKAIQKSRTPRQASEALNQIIDEIGVSHTAFVPQPAYQQLTGGESGDLGITLQRHPVDDGQGYFVIDLMPGSAGYESGLKLGDQILNINDVAIDESSRLMLAGEEQRHQMFFVRVGTNDTVRMEYRRRQNGGIGEVELTARKALDAVDVLKNSARVIESGENRIGYVRYWNLMSMEIPARTRSLYQQQFRSCHAVILDLRGRGGLIPVVLGVENVVKDFGVPVIAITDDLTRSGKEMLSLLLKKQEHVTVIGQKTAGAVTGATFALLPSGNALMYPAASAEVLKRFTDGKILEGRGVEPDEYFDFQIPFCGGNDRLLEAAVETANAQIQEILDSLILP